MCLFDNIKLRKAGEYLVRGIVENAPFNEGFFEPCRNLSANSAHDAHVVAATSIVRRDERNLVPIRILTLRDNVNLKKGYAIGSISALNTSGCENIRTILLNKEERWQALEVKFAKHFPLMSESCKKKMVPLLHEFADIFSVSKSDIGLTDMVTHEIDTGNEYPICTPYRRIPMALEDKVDDMVKEMEGKGIVRPSVSPWNAPLVVVPKKNGDIRLTVDYRKLNSITKRPVFPMPDSRALLDTLSGSSYFTTLDLSSGYYNIPMKEEDIQKTAFSTRHNHWEFVRMPMGLSTAPASFQRLMHMVFHKENWKQCLIYLDDILIFADDMEEHLQRLRVVFERIREAGLKLSPDKCSFIQSKVSYLGYTISKDGIHTDKSKIEKITSWPLPKTTDELRSFLGLCGYYRHFIHNYAQTVMPLEEVCKPSWNRKMRKGKVVIELNTEQEECFKSLKHALTSAPILAFPTRNDEFVLDTDASHDAIGCVLSQRQEGIEKVIAYASKKLSQSERQYCITRKELLAVYHFVTHFKHYLLGRKFVVRTDHRALTWMLNWQRPSTSQYCRWKEELEIFDMRVQYRPGSRHLNADALSRLPGCEQCELQHLDPKRRKNVKILNKDEKDNICCRRMVMFEKDMNQEDDPVLKVIITSLKKSSINEREPEAIKFGNEECKSLWTKRKKLRIRGDLLYLLTDEGKYKLIVPGKKRAEIIKMAHETMAHIGIKKTSHLLHQSYYWLNMDLDIKLVIASCKHCAERKCAPVKKHPSDSLSGGHPFDKVSIDITGPLSTGKHGERYILGIIDNFSKFPALIPLKVATAEAIAQAMYKHWICVFGVPTVIHSDRGTEFENQLMADLCKLLGIRKSRASPYYPQGDGIIERLFRTMKDMVYATTKCRGKNWVEIIPSVEMGLRCTQTKSWKLTPYEIVFGRQMVTPLNGDDWQKRIDKINLQTDFVKGVRQTLGAIHDKIRRRMERAEDIDDIERVFKIGEKVYVKILPRLRGMDRPRYEGPFEIINLKGRWCYVLRNCRTGRIVERNHYHIKRYSGNDVKGDQRQAATTLWSNLSGSKTKRIGAKNELRRDGETSGQGPVPRRSARIRKQQDRYGRS